MKAEGKTDSDHGKFEYFIQKPSSFYSPSLKNVKSLGLASLNVSGVLFKEESNESSYTSGNVRYTSITSTTWQFPELDDAFWETLLEKLYSSIQEKFSTNYAISFIDVDKITSHPEYANFWEPNATRCAGGEDRSTDQTRANAGVRRAIWIDESDTAVVMGGLVATAAATAAAVADAALFFRPFSPV